LARLDTGWFWNNIANRSEGFPHQRRDKVNTEKGDTSFMALARIITRSHLCSRELALDLIARGYAVEIVSPDSIPDNLADLELRVEEDPGNQLVASVEAHNGERTASLEFLHYLKAPMPDFIRRPPPEPHEAVHFPEPPVSCDVEQSAEDVELPADAPQLAPETVFPAAKILRDSKLDPELAPQPDSEEGARLILPPDPSPSLPPDPPNHSASASSTIARPIARPVAARPVTTAPTTALRRDVRMPWPQPFEQSSGPFQNVALILASMVLMMALGLGFSVRRGNKMAVQSSGAAPAASISHASIVTEKDTGKHQGQVSPLPVSPAATKAEGHPDKAPKESAIAKINPTAKAPNEVPTTMVGTTVSRRHGDDLIAPDTVTYLNQPSASRQPSSRKQDGVIAANTVTLDDKPAPKAAKQDSDIKRYSDLK